MGTRHDGIFVEGRFVPAISGGALEVEDAEQIKTIVSSVVTETVKPFAAGLEDLKGQVAKIGEDGESLKRAVRIEREGDREFTLLNGERLPLGKGIAPAFVRSGSLGDRPLLLTDFCRMMLAGRNGGDTSKFSRLQDVSAKLQKFGHQRSQDLSSWVLPIATDPDYFDDGTEEAASFCREIKQAAWIDPSPDESLAQLRWLAGKLYGAKQQASDNDLLGGSLAELPQTGDIIGLLQATAVLGRAGARGVPLPMTGMRFPKETGEPTFAYANENGTIGFTTVSTGVLNMSPKKAGAIIKIPFELLRMVNAAESFFRSSLVRKAALTEDLSGLEGVGGSQIPKGIIRYDRSAATDVPETDKVTLHTAGTAAANGDTFAPEDPSKMIAAIETANEIEGATAWVMRPFMWAAITNRRVDQGSGPGTGAFAFQDVGRLGDTPNKSLRGVPVLTTTQVNKTSRKGNATNLTYILLGNFRRMLLGRVGSVELASDTSLGFAEEQVWVRAVYRHDVAVEHAQSFTIAPTLLEA